ncbi:MAG: adenylyltransferase/cytidyltransferase family protein [Haloferacaceae archaeon]
MVLNGQHPNDDETTNGQGPPEDATRVVAQGTFDILHPGHVHYLRDAAAMGDELHVIVARRDNVTHKEKPVLPDRQRRDMVAALSPVDHAHLGHEEDIFVPIERIEPDVIVLGFDQHHDEDAIEQALSDRGLDCRVERASARERRFDGELLSTGEIIDRILKQRG